MWNSIVPVLVFDSASRRIVQVNDAAAALFKSSSEDMVGQSVDGCVVSQERTRLVETIGINEIRWGDVGPWQCLARDGSSFIAHVRFHQMLYEGELVHVILATRVVQLGTSLSAAAGSGASLPRRD